MIEHAQNLSTRAHNAHTYETGLVRQVASSSESLQRTQHRMHCNKYCNTHCTYMRQNQQNLSERLLPLPSLPVWSAPPPLSPPTDLVDLFCKNVLSFQNPVRSSRCMCLREDMYITHRIKFFVNNLMCYAQRQRVAGVYTCVQKRVGFQLNIFISYRVIKHYFEEVITVYTHTWTCAYAHAYT